MQTKQTKEQAKNKKLTPKQKKFVEEYIKNWGNGSDAVRKAWYNIGGKWWSKTKKQQAETVWAIAKENLEKPQIQGFLAEHWEFAKNKILDMMNNAKSENVRADLAKYTFDQVHGKAVQKQIILGDKDNPLSIDINTADTTTLLKLLGR